jgi:recombination protein RecA
MKLSKILDDLSEVVGKSEGSDSIPYWLKTSLPNVNLAVSGDQDLGFPGGRLITIAGPESCGKTALASELMREAQSLGGFAFFDDFEHAFHHGHASALGVECDDEADNWYYRKPATAEEGFDIAYWVLKTIRANEMGVELPKDTAKNPHASNDALRNALSTADKSRFIPIVGVMDSIASMTPRAQDIDYKNQNMKTKNMELAMMLSIELKRLSRDVNKAGATMVLLNQIRNNPGVMFGDSTTEPGGNAPKFYASVMLRLRRAGKWYAEYGDNKSEVIGDVVELLVRKNKVARPFKKTRYVFRTIDPVGLDVIGTMIMIGKEAGALGAVGGTTLTFEGKRFKVSEFDNFCREHDDVKARLIDHVMSEVGGVTEGPVLHDDEEEKSGAFAGIPVVDAPEKEKE